MALILPGPLVDAVSLRFGNASGLGNETALDQQPHEVKVTLAHIRGTNLDLF